MEVCIACYDNYTYYVLFMLYIYSNYMDVCVISYGLCLLFHINAKELILSVSERFKQGPIPQFVFVDRASTLYVSQFISMYFDKIHQFPTQRHNHRIVDVSHNRPACTKTSFLEVLNNHIIACCTTERIEMPKNQGCGSD